MVGMAARVFAAMSRARISVVLITQSSSEYSISFCVPQSDCVRAGGQCRKSSTWTERRLTGAAGGDGTAGHYLGGR
ncbi:ACT domain-containing protein [Escherichia coli]